MEKEKEDKWNLQSACACIIRNGGKANPYQKKLSHPNPGLKVLGAMDYLKTYHKFVTISEDNNKELKEEITESNQPKTVIIKKRKRKLKEV